MGKLIQVKVKTFLCVLAHSQKNYIFRKCVISPGFGIWNGVSNATLYPPHFYSSHA